MQRLELGLVQVNRYFVAAALAIMFTIVFLNVVLRYGFAMSLPWVEETARYLMIAITFLGAGLALREGRLVAIELIQALLPVRLRTALRWLIVAVLMVFMGALLWYGAHFVAFGWNKQTMATQIPRGIPYLAIPLGAAVFMLHLAFFMRRFANESFEFDGEGEPHLEAPKGRAR